MKKVAVIYDRASTDKQKDNWSREDAERIGGQLAQKHGFISWKVETEVVSGEELLNRPIMRNILERAEAGEIEAIIVQNFARLSRDEDGIDGLTIKKTCKANNVLVITPSKVYDFSNEQDDKMSDIEFMVAKWYKSEMMKYVMQGMRGKAQAGGYMGGPPPFGYKLVYTPVSQNEKPEADLAIDESWGNFFKDVFETYISRSTRQMAEHIKALGYRKPNGSEWLRKDFPHIVQNPIYAGFIAWGRNQYRTPSKYLKDYEVSYVFRPELQRVPIELWEAANKIRKERAATIKSPGKWARHVFSGLLACPFCKGPMYGRTSADYRGKEPVDRVKYYCYTHSQVPSNCPGKSFQDGTVNKALIPFLASAIEDNLWLNDALTEAINLFGKDSLEKTVEQEIRAKLTTTQEKMNRLTEAIADGVLLKAEVRDTMAELRETKGRLERELVAIAEKEAIREDYLRAVKAQQSDNLEADLWDMLKNSPRALQRLARMIIQPSSVVVATEGKGKAVKSRVESYEFTPDFKGVCETFYTRRRGLEP